MTSDSAARRHTVSMRVIVTVVAMALIAGAVLGVGAVGERNARKALTAEMEARLLAEARSLALLSSGALLSKIPDFTLVPLVKKMKGKADLAQVLVLDHEGKIQGHEDARAVGTSYDYLQTLSAAPGERALEMGEEMLANEQMLVATAPVYPSPTDRRRIGTAIVGLQQDAITARLTAARREQTAIVAIVLALGVLATMLVMSALLRPISLLRAGLERIGQGDLTTRLDVRNRTELGVLAGTINDMAGQLENAQAEMVEKKRLAHEMELARSIQLSLLPPGPTKVGDFAIHGAHKAAAEVGGDYYDIFSLPDGRVGIVIADVAGKGLGGCLVTSMLAVLLRSLRDSHESPADLLATLETNLGSSLQTGTFITMFYGLLDPQSGRMTYASAAHTPLLHYRAGDGSLHWYRTRGIPIGAVRGGALRGSLEDQQIVLEPGDLALQFTDGINEAWDERTNEQFDFPRVETAVRELAPRGVEAVLEGIQQQVSDWTGPHPPMDDETLLGIGHTGSRVVPARGLPSHDAGHGTGGGAGRTITNIVVGDGSDLAGELWSRRDPKLRLSLAADLDSLGRIRPWLQSCPDLGMLSSEAQGLLESALYEVCSNIIEHGYGCSASENVDLWWVPHPQLASDGPSGGNGGSVALFTRVCQGYFLFRDHGPPPSPREWPLPDLAKAESRRRGRGLGLHIIRRVMTQIEYHPSLPQGNLTFMRFDPQQHSS